MKHPEQEVPSAGKQGHENAGICLQVGVTPEAHFSTPEHHQITATPRKLLPKHCNTPEGTNEFWANPKMFFFFLLFFILILDLADALENCNAQIQESKRGMNTLFNPNLNPNPNRNPNNGRSSLRFLSLLGCIHS